jgi:hypothetical protein
MDESCIHKKRDRWTGAVLILLLVYLLGENLEHEKSSLSDYKVVTDAFEKL